MIIYEKVMEALDGIGVPVVASFYDGNEDTYITFQEIDQRGALYGDGEEILTSHIVQVDIWSKYSFGDLVYRVKERMKEAGFIRITEVDTFEKDTGIFHRAIRFRLTTTKTIGKEK